MRPDAQLAIDLDAIFDRAARRVYEKRVAAGDADAELFKRNADALWAGFKQGANVSKIDWDFKSPQYDVAAKFRRSIRTFAIFKSHQNVRDLAASAIDPKTGALRSWAEFRPLALAISQNYNVAWLKTEFQTAVASAQSAQKWLDFQANADILPNLRYSTVGDARVRDSHAALDGVTLPIGHAFWDSFFPPNGWNCRCTVQQVGAGHETDEANIAWPDAKDVPPAFRVNPGKTGELYSNQHPYFSETDPATRARLLDALRSMPATEADFDFLRADKKFEKSLRLVEKVKLTDRFKDHDPVEVAALHFYTDSGIYGILNKRMRKGLDLGPFLDPFDATLRSALAKLPAHRGEVWRGAWVDRETATALVKKANDGSAFTPTAFWSTSQDRETSMAYLNEMNPPAGTGPVLFQIESKTGRDIRAFHFSGPIFVPGSGTGEGEVLFAPSGQFDIVSFGFVGHLKIGKADVPYFICKMTEK